ncbi:MAG: hypothetical protein ACRDOL_25595 [Streptosporangiaceae bacterium]
MSYPPNPTAYAERAENHWRRFLPAQYEAIPPDSRPGFFDRLGQQIQDRVTARAQQMIDQAETAARPGRQGQPPSYLAQLALMTTLRHDAEVQVLAEMLPAREDPSDPEEPEDPSDPEDLADLGTAAG